MNRYCSQGNYFSLDEINKMMYTGLISLRIAFESKNRYRLTAYLCKNWPIPPEGFPNFIHVCLGSTRVLSRLPSKRFSLVRNELLSNDYYRRCLRG